MIIKTGFLSGNVFGGEPNLTDAQCEVLAEEIKAALEKQYGENTVVEVNWQRGSGSLPWDLKTRVYESKGEYDLAGEVESDVETAIRRFYEKELMYAQ